MNKKIISFISIIAICAGVFTANSWLMPEINRLREGAGLTRNMPLENAPPQLVLAINLLGAFRSIVIDVLWMRSMRLREEGKFFEMAQLARWICQLEPNIEDVWTHHAWNMAYNISYEMQSGADRWRWIKRAIHLLRNDGLMYNAHSAVIRKEIAWIYSHKIGQHWDDEHWYYKQALAREMTPYISVPEDVAVLAALPPIEQELANNTVLRTMWEKVMEQSVKTIDGFDQSIALSFASKYDSSTITLLRLYLRKYILEEYYKLDLNTMKSLMDTYGPMDWRLPEPHAVYWASEGRKYAEEHTFILYDRLIYLAVQSLYRRGTLYFSEADNDAIYLTTPNTAFITPMNKLYQTIFERYAGRPAITNIAASYKHFLTEIVILLYTFNQKQEAEKYYNVLREKFPDIAKQDSFERFVINQFSITAQTGNYDKVKNLLFSLLFQGYWLYALGHDEEYAGYIQLTAVLWKEYTRLSAGQKRLRLPAVDVLAQQVVDYALESGFPPALRESLRARIQQAPAAFPEGAESDS
ncbi:hypothetical protein KDK77_01010 [bacterium]|nr:hypothetical protein [bacterium]